MERMDNLLLFLISMGSQGVSLPLVWCWLLACCILPLLCSGMFLYTSSLKELYHEGLLYFVKRFFWQLMRCSGGFYFSVFYMVDCVDRFSYVETSLHLWDEANLITVDDVSNVFLDSICQYFI